MSIKLKFLYVVLSMMYLSPRYLMWHDFLQGNKDLPTLVAYSDANTLPELFSSQFTSNAIMLSMPVLCVHLKLRTYSILWLLSICACNAGSQRTMSLTKRCAYTGVRPRPLLTT